MSRGTTDQQKCLAFVLTGRQLQLVLLRIPTEHNHPFLAGARLGSRQIDDSSLGSLAGNPSLNCATVLGSRQVPRLRMVESD